MFIYFIAIWNSLRLFGVSYDHLVNIVFIWYFFGVGIIHHETTLVPTATPCIKAATFSLDDIPHEMVAGLP
jgi:hypothetical protein